MPKHLQFKCAFQTHDLDPKNSVCINPTFRHQTWQLGEDPLPADANALAQEMADKLALITGTIPITVKVYDIEKAKPNFPIGTAVKNPAAAPRVISVVPEAAVCLSFYADINRPRHRGRLYLPAWLCGASVSNMGREVPSAMQTAASDIAIMFAGLGGGNVDWGVWSRVDHAFHKATNYWISSAWATVRSRGIKESNRMQFTTSG